SKRPELDILLNVRIPKTNNRGYFKKISRTALDFAIVNLALVKQEEGYNIVIGARPNVAKKAIKAMGLLNASADITENDFDLIAKTAVDELNFSTNSKASADYRKDLARIYIKRGLKVVIGK
ncbi:MAG: FAD-binding protein, partial [Bacilli bacterium]|nr:FAD-binding protein [Bacilli bacterium]